MLRFLIYLRIEFGEHSATRYWDSRHVWSKVWFMKLTF